jgi:hypothetical protein
VIRVSDGDTVVVMTEGPDELTVRLAAVNAPDRGECHADESLALLEDIVGGGEVEMVRTGTDQFGRTLAHLYAGGSHVNLELVALGMALVVTPDPDDGLAGGLIGAEEQAFSSGLGLWGPDSCGRKTEIPELVIEAALSRVDPPGPDDERLAEELVVIVNPGSVGVDLSGWLLRDESARHRFTFPVGTSLGPGDRLTVSSDDEGWSPGDGPVWNNGGDVALLLDPVGTVVARWRY